MTCRMLALMVCGGLTSWVAGQEVGGRAPARPTGESQDKPVEAQRVNAQSATSPLDFSMKDIEGRSVDLSKYRGDAVLMVNVASQCGMTPQYEQLQALHEKYAARGLRILGFPANNFGGQEPGTNAEIREFCKTRYHVAFDLFSKVSVKGEDCCELYKFLTSKEKNRDFGGEIRWNFTKFLLDRQGKVVARFEPRTRPDAAEVIDAIEAALRGPRP